MDEQEKINTRRRKIEDMRKPWTCDELKEEILFRTKQLPFDFIVDKENTKIIELLCMYYSGDERFNKEEIVYAEGKKLKLSLKKGIGLVSKKKGTGKSVLMRLFQQNKFRPFIQTETKTISDMFNKKGVEAIELHSDLLHIPPHPNFYYYQDVGICFDDLGFELPKNFWGSKSDVMADVLFNIYSKNQIRGDFSAFHFTSNLYGNEFEQRYDDRIRDRMREMFNTIVLTGESRRK